MNEPQMKTVEPTAMDEALHKDILSVIQRHLFPNTPERVLAIASQVVGQVLALQNPVTLSKDAAIALVMVNIEKGNQDFISQMVQADKNRTGQTRSI